VYREREKEREREREKREKIKFFFIFSQKNELPPKNIKKIMKIS
jgi:hypothetical protein